MSAIYFHSLEEDVTVRGSERAHFGCLISDFTFAVFTRYTEEYSNPSPLRKILPESCYLHSSKDFKKDFRTWIGVSDQLIGTGDMTTNLFVMQLNTVLALGSNSMKLAARLHGQCEIHAWVEGKNRAWLASIIEQGVKTKLYRDNQGWEKVIEFLKSRDDSPVVTSYSVCEQFPNRSIAGYKSEKYYDLPEDKKWAKAMSGLRKSKAGLEMRPDEWESFYFGNNVTAMDLIEIAIA